MDKHGTNPDKSLIHQDLHVESDPSVEELRKQSDSLIQNIGALQFAINRIEVLEAHNLLLCEILKDCRPCVEVWGPKTLAPMIDAALKEVA